MKYRRILLALGVVAVGLVFFFVFSLVRSGRQVDVTLGEAQQAMQDKRWEEAAEGFRQVLRIRSNDLEALAGLAESQYQLGLYTDSLQQTRKVLSLSPGDRIAEIRVALCLFQLGNIEKAREEFEALLTKYPGSYEVRAGLGSCLVTQARSADQQGRDALLQRAEEQITQSLQIRPGSLEGLLALAEVQFLAGQIQEASSTAAQVMAMDAESTFAADLMGQAALELGAFAQAEDFFNKALLFRRNTTPTVSATIRDHLGIAVYYQDKLQMALDEWNRANQIDPAYHPAYDNNGCLALLRQKNNRAVELFTIGMQLVGFGTSTESTSSVMPSFQQKVSLLLRAASARLRLEQYNDASLILEQLTRLAGEQAFGFLELGNVQYLRGRREDALRAYEQAWALAQDVAVGYNYGSLLLEQGSYTKSQEVLAKVIELDPANLEARLNLGDALLNARNIRGASEQFQKASDIAPNNALPMIRMGQTLELIGDLKRAEQAYLKGIELDPSNGRTHFFLGLLRRRMTGATSLAQAEQDLVKAVELEPLNDSARTELGYVFLKSGKLIEAEDQFKTVLDNPLYPSYDKAYNGLGNVYMAHGEWDKAKECFDAVIERNRPGQVEVAEINLGNLAFVKGDFELARQHYEAALLARSTLPEGSYNLACAFGMEGNWNRAVVELQNCLNRDSRFGKAWYNLGVAFEKTGRPDRALDSFSKEEGEAILRAKLSQVRLYTDQGNLKKAQDILAEAEAMEEPMAPLLAIKANLQLRLGAASEAIASAREGQRKVIREEAAIKELLEPQLQMVLGCALALNGDWSGASQEFTALLASAPQENRDVRLNLGLAYANLGQFEQAENIYEELIQSSPDDPRPYAYRGNLLLGQGDYARARQNLARSLQLDSNQPAVRQAFLQIQDL